MNNIDVLKNKLQEVRKYISLVQTYQKFSLDELLKDATLKGAVERYLYLVCQTAIDLGEALVSYHNLRTPSTYAEVFEILKEQKILSPDVSFEMEKMVGFRNILAHAYGKVNFDIVYQVLKKNINKIERFTQEVKDKMDF